MEHFCILTTPGNNKTQKSPTAVLAVYCAHINKSDFLTPEGVTDRLSRNVGTDLPLEAA
jgi:hypothetical protein